MTGVVNFSFFTLVITIVVQSVAGKSITDGCNDIHTVFCMGIDDQRISFVPSDRKVDMSGCIADGMCEVLIKMTRNEMKDKVTIKIYAAGLESTNVINVVHLAFTNEPLSVERKQDTSGRQDTSKICFGDKVASKGIAYMHTGISESNQKWTPAGYSFTNDGNRRPNNPSALYKMDSKIETLELTHPIRDEKITFYVYTFTVKYRDAAFKGKEYDEVHDFSGPISPSLCVDRLKLAWNKDGDQKWKLDKEAGYVPSHVDSSSFNGSPLPAMKLWPMKPATGP